MVRRFFLCFLIITTTSFIFPNDNEMVVQQELSEVPVDVDPSVAKVALSYAYHICKAFLQAEVENYGGTVVHEFGHYTVLKTVYPENKATIHIAPKAWGVIDNSYVISAPRLFTIGDLNVYLGRNYPSWCYWQVTRIDDEDLAKGCKTGEEYRDKWEKKYYGKHITMCLAGGAFEVIYHYALFFMSAMQQKYSETHDMKTSIMWSLKNAFFPFESILDQKDLTKPELIGKLILYSQRLITLFAAASYAFLPGMKANGDGNNAWKALLGENTFNKIPKENLQQIVNLLCEVVIWYKAISTYKAYVEKYQLNGDQAIASA